MECRHLKQIVGLIKLYSAYNSNAAIAQRLGIKERTLTGYWEEDKGGGTIPDKNVEAFCDLIVEIIPGASSRSAARALLGGHPVAFHNALLPVGGRAWRMLVDGPGVQALTVKVKPLATMGFGEVEEETGDEPETTARLSQRFCFEGVASWRGEAVLFAEHAGEWHALRLAKDERAIILEGGPFTLPPKQKGEQTYLRERTKPGLYRYVAIAQRDKFAPALRELLHQTNPYGQLTLDLIGDHLITVPERSRMVAAAVLLIEE